MCTSVYDLYTKFEIRNTHIHPLPRYQIYKQPQQYYIGDIDKPGQKAYSQHIERTQQCLFKCFGNYIENRSVSI